MKILMYLLFFVSVASIHAQEFKPYKVKSGKIIYEKLKYSTRATIKWENGIETGSREQIPYVAEQIIYFWDDFGDVAFEEIYQVSKFGGELLPEKVKIAERLWVNEHRYYFNIKDHKISDDPYYLRIKCKENFQYYQIKGSWIETLHMGAETSETKNIIGKEADYYRIDNYQDIYAWKGLVLKTENYSTSGSNGPRNTIERVKVAVEIDTTSLLNKELFNPTWLKREKLYNSLDENKIVEIIDARPDVTEQADHIEGVQLQKNDILLFVTSKLTIGKMQVIAIDKDSQLTVKYSLYSYNNVIDWGNPFRIRNNAVVNIDSPHAQNVVVKELDFKWIVTNKATLFPQNAVSLFLLKTSRTKTLEIKKFVRKH